MKKKRIREESRPPSRHPRVPLSQRHKYPTPSPFRCRHCSLMVFPEGAGTAHRNHCPHCLQSLHLDNEPGDREAECGCLMEPIALWVRQNREWCLIHRCTGCGTLSSCRAAADDNPYLLLSLAAKPLALPPFPLDRLPGLAEDPAQNLA